MRRTEARGIGALLLPGHHLLLKTRKGKRAPRTKPKKLGFLSLLFSLPHLPKAQGTFLKHKVLFLVLTLLRCSDSHGPGQRWSELIR